ncbi:MAG TPA: FeoA domain-containing protein [Terriglobales bacterium]|nr:FeoA domain-containing protein [Terriglobales bacterium]
MASTSVWVAVNPQSALWLTALSLAVIAVVLIWSAPRLYRQFNRWRDFRDRVLLEDVLKHIYTLRSQGREAGLDTIAGCLGVGTRRLLPALQQMERAGLVFSTAGRFALTEEGGRLALQVVRAHRLWETYLAQEAGVAMANIHGRADRHEHRIVADRRVDELDALLGHPRTDPHGDPIPAATGEMPIVPVQPLTDWPIGEPATVVHVEDEPEPLLREIVQQGLKPGSVLWVVDRGPAQLVVGDGKRKYPISALAAGNIHVRATAERELSPESLLPLSALKPGDEAAIVALDDALRGFTRRRLLDLGLTRNVRISPQLGNAFGDPIGYRVRGTVVALRREQASRIWVRRLQPEPVSTPVGES